jgi:hypothetical protein
MISYTQSPIRMLDNRLTTWKYGKGKWAQNSSHNPLDTWKKSEWIIHPFYLGLIKIINYNFISLLEILSFATSHHVTGMQLIVICNYHSYVYNYKFGIV